MYYWNNSGDQGPYVGQPWSIAPTYYTIFCNNVRYRIGVKHQCRNTVSHVRAAQNSRFYRNVCNVSHVGTPIGVLVTILETRPVHLYNILFTDVCHQQCSPKWENNINIIDALFAPCVVLQNSKTARMRAWSVPIIPPTGVRRTPNSRLPVSRSSKTSHKMLSCSTVPSLLQ